MEECSDVEKQSKSDVSCFTLDGVVAEMVIVVDEENEPLTPHKSLNIIDEYKKLKSSNNKDEIALDSKPCTDSSSVSAKRRILQSDMCEEDKSEINAAECDEHEQDAMELDTKETISSNIPNDDKEDEQKKILKNNGDFVKADQISINSTLKSDEHQNVNTVPEKSGSTSKYKKVELKVNPNKVDKKSLLEDVKSSLEKPEPFHDVMGISTRGRKRKFKEIMEEHTVAKKIKKPVKNDYIKRRRRKRGSTVKNETQVQAKKYPPKSKTEKPLTKKTASEAKSEEQLPRRNSLRKMSIRKNDLAPDVPDFKPKIFWINGVGQGIGEKLGNIPSVMKYIKRERKGQKALYRILFYQWPSGDLEEIINKIKNFDGFPFDEKSFECIKRKRLLNSTPNLTVSRIAKILGIKEKAKSDMVSDILHFLMKPRFLNPESDPTMQPYVKLERLSLGGKHLHKVLHENSLEAPLSTKRKRFVSAKLRQDEYLPLKNVSAKSVKVKTTAAVSPKVDKGYIKAPKKPDQEKVEIVPRRRPGRPPSKKKKAMYAAKKEVTVNELEKEVHIKDKSKVQESSKSAIEETKNEKPITEEQNELMEPGLMEPKIFVKSSVEIPVKEISKKDKVVRISSNESPMFEKEVLEENSNAASKKQSPIKKPGLTRYAKPLSHFNKIKESISKANFSALQRLHILLFGASDKAENLKGNILAFGGFPFLEGSEEWKQKQFLLSLLAQNTLREYLNLLCIEHGDDDQNAMINKLMKFLAMPNKSLIENESGIKDFETEVVSSELINNAPIVEPVKEVVLKKAHPKKKVKPKTESRRGRKVLMDEAQVRRLEADIAREQRILARERKLNEELMAKQTPTSLKVNTTKTGVVPVDYKNLMLRKESMIVKQADAEQLNALLQTVYKRRALKAAGAVVSTPNKGEKTKLGDLPNVKFLIVTASYSDLDVLHYLIYMCEATKARVRKSILDFDGFGFNEDSAKYKERMDFLNSLGYDISKRIAFHLGLCPFQTDIPQRDLNELIMYFLMSPCKTKEVPITHMPLEVPLTKMPKEMSLLVLKHNEQSSANSNLGTKSQVFVPEVKKLGPPAVKKLGPPEKLVTTALKIQKPVSETVLKQKAKKSLKPMMVVPPVKKFALPTLPKSTEFNKIPTPEISLPSETCAQTQSTAITSQLQPTSLQSAQLLYQKNVSNAPTSPQILTAQGDYLVQQQTPDGQQKTYKLIRLPPNHPLTSVVLKNPVPQPQQHSALQNLPLTGTGYVVLKNNPVISSNNQTFLTMMPSGPVVVGQQGVKFSGPVVLSSPSTNTVTTSKEGAILLDAGVSQLPDKQVKSEAESTEVHHLEVDPPSDDDLFTSIQEIIHSSNFEDITLRNVIDRVSAQFSKFDLTQRHNFMKECVKKIIIGT